MSSPSSSATRAASSTSRRRRLSRSGQNRKARLATRRSTQRREEEASFESTGIATRQELGLREADEEIDERAQRRLWPLLRIFVEKKYLRQFFRVCAFVNVLSLIFSAPFVACDNDDYIEGSGSGDLENDSGRCDRLFVWFVVITCIDFIVSIVYTLQLIARVECAIYLRIHKDRPLEPGEFNYAPYTTWIRLLNLIIVTFSLWWSVALGIARSVREGNDESSINPNFYMIVALRSLAVFTTIQLFLNVQFPVSAKELLGNIKWKQLFFVALFYLFFLYIYALIGVQLIGGLGHRCVYNDTGNIYVTVPVTHCNPDETTYEKQCYGGIARDEIDCIIFPDDARDENIAFRNQVYFGQFRYIVDAMFAVYEASSLELWSFFSYNALDGASGPVGAVSFFYLSMVFYLVIFVQQSIFLVVIIESFADLRSAKGIGSAEKPKDKPLIVLTEQASATDLSDRLKLQTQREESVQFTNTLDKWYHQRVEKVFLALVAIDAVITAIKHTDMNEDLAIALQVWQMFVSILFVVEIMGLIIFHLVNTNQYSLFLRRPYYWYLLVVAWCGLIAALPLENFYWPLHAGNALAVFQAARLPRLIRTHKTISNFFLKIVGDGTKLLVIIALTGIFLMFFAVINMQLFGYIQPSDRCKDFGNSHFDNFFLALQSMFQLIMQEGWSELVSEEMCFMPTWILINFYFIFLHLISSLLLLNFFVAVILDNLDYDEETKKELLQQVVEKKTTQKVPEHLKLLTTCGPKLISAPKISAAIAAGVEVPNLTEADVKNFYESGEAARDGSKEASGISSAVTEQVFPQQQTVSTATIQRRPSELSQLELLSVDSNITSTVSSHHDRFQLIQGILESVRWLRKQNTDQEGRRPGLEGGPQSGLFGDRKHQDTSQSKHTGDEYDQYRAKYRLFDSALFLMSPDNRFRRFCKAILTRQMSEPLYIKTRLTPINLVKNMLSYYGRYIVSRLPYFTWFMVMVTLSAIVVQIVELYTSFDRPDLISSMNSTSSSIENLQRVEPLYFWVADLFFVIFTLVELILKILANGFFLNPDAAIRSVWDVMDWVVVLSSAIILIVNTSVCGSAVQQIIVFSHMPPILRFVLCLRALRPLRTISLIPQMRRVISDVLLGWKQLLYGVLLLFVGIFMFASLGVQLFAGNYPKGPQAFCNDPSKQSLEACLNSSTVQLRISTSREFLPNSNYSPSILVPTVWYTHRRDFSFDTTPNAMLTMFEVLTLEGWLDVRDMLVGDPVTPGIPSTQEAWYMAIFLHIFIFFGVNIGLQLFVGIVVNNFNAHKPGNSALLSVAQKRWTDLVLRISLLRPIKRPEPPDRNKFRLALYKVMIHRLYRHFSTAIIILQSFCFVVPWGIEHVSATMALMTLVMIFAVYFFIEQCVKLMAFGLKGYFSSWRNIADTFIAILGFCYIIWAIVILATGYESVSHTDRTMLTNFALTYAVLKCFTILGKYSIMQNLFITVVRTLIGSTPLTCVLVFIILTYAFIGDIIFLNLRTGEGITFSRVNFDGTFSSFYLAFRVMTGEDWHHLLWDAMIGNHYCSKLDGNCGNVAIALLWFITYYILITVFLLNIIIAHLLENFSIFYNEDDTSLSHTVIKDFKQNWLHFDKRAAGTIKSNRIKLFLRTLKLQHYYTYTLSENNGVKLKEREQVPLLTDSLILREMADELQREPRGAGGGGNVKPPGLGNKQLSEEILINDEEVEDHSFQSVLKMLAYRAEDIKERLEPQELYDRQEFEESIQFDVAEECILKWIKKYVQPVLDARVDGQTTIKEQHHRSTMPPRMDSFWPIDGDEELTQPSDDEGEVLLSTNPMILRKWLGSPSLPSEDLPEPPRETQTDDHHHESAEEKLVSQSYARLARISLTPFTQGGGAGGEDRWHDWFRMQRQWGEQIDGTNQNYFDDGL